jgi:hypothetical protein
MKFFPRIKTSKRIPEVPDQINRCVKSSLLFSTVNWIRSCTYTPALYRRCISVTSFLMGSIFKTRSWYATSSLTMASRTITYTDPYGHGNLTTKLLFPPGTTTCPSMLADHPGRLFNVISKLSVLSMAEYDNISGRTILSYPSEPIVYVLDYPIMVLIPEPSDGGSHNPNPQCGTVMDPYFAKSEQATVRSKLGLGEPNERCLQCRRFNRPEECTYKENGKAVRQNCSYFPFVLGAEVFGSPREIMRELQGLYFQRKRRLSSVYLLDSPNFSVKLY